MVKRFVWLVWLVVVLAILVPRLGTPDLTVRECIIHAPVGTRWQLAGDSVWRTVATVEFSNVRASDIIVQGTYAYHEGPGQTGARIELQLILDGVASFVAQHRPHTGYPTSRQVRALFTGIAPGAHTLQLRARNRSSFEAYLANVWLTPFLVEAAEQSASSDASAVTVPGNNSWTSLVTTVLVPGPGESTANGFYTVEPCRVVDTRLTGGALAAGTSRVVQVGGACGIPQNASSVSINVTAVDPTDQGELVGFPTGNAVPNTSTVAYKPGVNRANNSILRLGNTQLSFRNNSTGSVHLIVDVNGYFVEGRLVVLGAYAAVSSGTTNQQIEYRIVRNGAAIGTFYDSVSAFLPTGQNMAVIDRAPAVGTNTYALQARTTGGNLSVSVSQLFALTMPGHFSVYEGTAENLTLPADRQWQPIAVAPTANLAPGSVGPYGTRGFGVANLTYNGPFSSEALLQWDFLQPAPFEVGVIHVHGTAGKMVMEGMPTDWEKLGFVHGLPYSMQLKAKALCTSASPLGFRYARFQAVVLPDYDGYVAPYVCAANPGPGGRNCCSFYPECLVYSCEPGLPAVSSVGTDCSVD